MTIWVVLMSCGGDTFSYAGAFATREGALADIERTKIRMGYPSDEGQDDYYEWKIREETLGG